MNKNLKHTLIAAAVAVAMVVVIFIACRLLHCDKADIAFAIAVSALVLAVNVDLRSIDNSEEK